jgi:tetratricopeptide (TPR) repeat protein
MKKLFYLMRAHIRIIALDDFKGGIDDYTRAIEINPEYAAAYYNRGSVKIVLGQKDSARMDLIKAGELGIPMAYEAIKRYCQ